MDNITKDNFIITESAKGFYTVRWKHNNSAIKTMIQEKEKANNFVKWIVGYLNKETVQ